MPVIFLVFVIVPVVELSLLITVGGYIGTLPTVGIVLSTAFIGATLLRREGISTLTNARNKLESGQMPAMEMLEAVMLVIGGAFLLTPGFLTDIVGFSCLIPPIRRAIVNQLLKRSIIQVGQVNMFGNHPYNQPRQGRGQVNGHQTRQGDTIDGEYRREDPPGP